MEIGGCVGEALLRLRLWIMRKLLRLRLLREPFGGVVVMVIVVMGGGEE